MKNLPEALESITTALININDRLNHLEGRFEGALEGQEMTNRQVRSDVLHLIGSIDDQKAMVEGQRIEFTGYHSSVQSSLASVAKSLDDIRDETEYLRNHNDSFEPRLMAFNDRLGNLATSIKDVKHFAEKERMAVNQRFIKLESTEFDTSALSAISPTLSEVVEPVELVHEPYVEPVELGEDDTVTPLDAVERAIKAFPNHDVVLIDEFLGIKNPDDDVDPITGMTRASIITPTDDGDPPFDVADPAYHQLVEVIG